MSVRFVWRGEHVNRQVRAKAREALQEAGSRALARCRELTPVRTGALRRSMRTVVDVQRMKVSMGSDLRYAPFIEYGTSRGVPAYAMIRRSLDEFIPEFQQIVRAALGDQS